MIHFFLMFCFVVFYDIKAFEKEDPHLVVPLLLMF